MSPQQGLARLSSPRLCHRTASTCHSLLETTENTSYSGHCQKREIAFMNPWAVRGWEVWFGWPLSSLKAHSPTLSWLNCTVSCRYPSLVVEPRQYQAPTCLVWVFSFDDRNRMGGISISFFFPPSTPYHILTLLLPTQIDIAVPFFLFCLPFLLSLPTHAQCTGGNKKSDLAMLQVIYWSWK